MAEQTATNTRLVSITIPAYNCEETIGAAVQSCLEQTHAAIEIVVVNDGSTDGTADVLAGFGVDIRVIDQPNGGLAAARNAGLRAARGEFVAWMDADDLAHRERIAIQADVLTSQPRTVLVSSDFTAFLSEDMDFEISHIASYYYAYKQLGGASRIYTESSATTNRVTVRWGHVYEQLLSGNFVHPPTVMAKRRYLDEVGACDETLRYSSDYDLLIRLSRLGNFAFVDAPLLRYRRSEKQMSAASRGITPLETVRILEKVRSRDPAIYSKCRSLFRRRIAESFINAASIIGPTKRWTALRLLWNALLHKIMFERSLRVLARIVLPDLMHRRAARLLHGSARRSLILVPMIMRYLPDIPESSMFAP
jgi:glycosyltransferase involved in cell wall biosynthesis